MIWIVGKMHSSFEAYVRLHKIPFGIFMDARSSTRSVGATQVHSLDMDGEEKIIQQLDALALVTVTAVMVAGYENYIVPASIIANYYGVAGMSLPSAIAATDKIIMRSAFAAYDTSITPDHAQVLSWEDVEMFMQDHQFPVMTKPASLMKSLLVARSSTMPELRKNFEVLEEHLAAAYKKQHVFTPPKAIIEEFIEGSMHTVAGFVDSEGQPHLLSEIVDCVRASDIGVQDSYLYSRNLPTVLSAEAQEELMTVAAKGVKALGLRSCPVHIELLHTADGTAKIIEIGARNGGYRPYMYEHSCGIDMYAASIAVAQRKNPDLGASRSIPSRVLELFPETEGVFAAFNGQREIEKLKSLKSFKIKASPGNIIGRASRGYKAAAIIVLSNNDVARLQADYDIVRTTALIRIG